MPIYEYSCGKCGEVVEKIQQFSDPPLKRHSGCGGSMTKLISQSSFQLKGSGWYVTDYAAKGKADGTDKSEGGDKSEDGGKKDKAAPGDSGDSGAGSDTDSKSAAKSEGSGKTDSNKKTDAGAKK